MTICCANRSAFAARYDVGGAARLSFMTHHVALFLRRPVDLQNCGVFERVWLAEKVFGRKVVDSATKQVADTLKNWGYGMSHKAHDESVLAEAMLLSGSPVLQDIRREVLTDLFTKCGPIQRRYALQRLSQALHHLGFIEAPLLREWSFPRNGQSPDLAANVDKRRGEICRAVVRHLHTRAGHPDGSPVHAAEGRPLGHGGSSGRCFAGPLDARDCRPVGCRCVPDARGGVA